MNQTHDAMWLLSKASRELLQWTQDEAARRAGISLSSVKQFEIRKGNSVGIGAALRVAYEDAGIQFVANGEHLGVLLRQ